MVGRFLLTKKSYERTFVILLARRKANFFSGVADDLMVFELGLDAN